MTKNIHSEFDPERQIGTFEVFRGDARKRDVLEMLEDEMKLVVPKKYRGRVTYTFQKPGNASEGDPWVTFGRASWKYTPAR
jgi:hypothetical protein